MLDPYLRDADSTLYHGDVSDVLRQLPAESVDCVVTSPPYWGLRDYGTGAWEGGDEGCDHKQGRDGSGRADGIVDDRAQRNRDGASALTRQVCRCGATRIDQQLGLEPTPEQYVERMVEVFREVRRVLASHGTVWLNLGDSYISQGGSREGHESNTGQGARREAEPQGRGRITSGLTGGDVPASAPGYLAAPGLKQKDLCGIPWRVAFALQADGWYLRSDIIWAKPNPMPESVTDRPTKAHEYVFLLSKQPRYFFDQEAVREKAEWARWGDQTNGKHEGSESAAGWIGSKSKKQLQGGRHARRYDAEEFKTTDERNTRFQGPNPVDGGRNIRSVWDIATQPYPEAHFATFPEELARRCIAAGTSERGKCPECGAPWVREVEHTPGERTLTDTPKRGGGSTGAGHKGSHGPGWRQLQQPKRSTLGWARSCEHDWQLAINPCTVLDPFMGSGTVAYVARKLGRHAVGIDLSAEYLALAARRLQQQSLFA